MQEDLDYLKDVCELLFKREHDSIDTEKMDSIVEKVPVSVALVETRIKNRLTELSKS